MLSRVADSLYWMARYLERAEHTARLVAVQTEMMLDQHSHAADERWKRILACLGDPIPAADGDNLTDTLLYDPRCRASIVACISAARENCRHARNEVSSQMWEQLNRMFHEVRRFASEDTLMAQPIEFLNYVEQGVHLFRGINDSTMSHSEGWHFVEVGQYLERAINTATLLDTHFRQQTRTSNGLACCAVVRPSRPTWVRTRWTSVQRKPQSFCCWIPPSRIPSVSPWTDSTAPWRTCPRRMREARGPRGWLAGCALR